MRKKELVIRIEEIFVMEVQKEFFVTYTENRLGHISTDKKNYKDCVIQTIINLYTDIEYNCIVIYYSQFELRNLIDEIKQVFQKSLENNLEMNEQLEAKGKDVSTLIDFKFEPKLIPIQDYFIHVDFSSQARKNDFLEVKQVLFQQMVAILLSPNFPLRFLETY